MSDPRIPTDRTELRTHNREIVERYMNTRGEDRLRRHLLFTEDGTGGLWTTESGEPIVIRGRDRLGEHAVWSLSASPTGPGPTSRSSTPRIRTASGSNVTERAGFSFPDIPTGITGITSCIPSSSRTEKSSSSASS